MASNSWDLNFYQHPIFTCDEFILVVDEQGKILEANTTCVTQLGYHTNKIIDSPFETFFEISKEQHTLLLSNIAEEKASKFETLIRRADGSTFPVYVSLSPMRTDSTSRIGVFIAIGSSSRLEEEVRLQKKASQMLELIKTTSHLMENLELKKVLEQLGRGAKGILDAIGCSIYILEQNSETLTPVVSLEQADSDEILSTPKSVHNSFIHEAVKAKRSLIFNEVGINDINFQPPYTPSAGGERVLVVPLVINDEVLGVMCLNRRGDIFTEDDLALASTIGTYAATALINAQAHEKLLREKEKRIQIEKALKDTKYEQAIVLDSVEESILYLDMDLRIEWLNRAAAESVALTKQELLSVHCYTIFHQRHEPCHDCPVKKARDTGVQHEAEITTPDGRVWYIKGYPRLGKTGEVASLVEVSREITFQRQRERQQEAVIQLSTALRSAQTLTEMLPVIVDQVHEIARAHGTALGLYDPVGRDVIVKIGIGGAAIHTGAHFPGDKGITGQVISTKEPYIHNDVLNDDLLSLTTNPSISRAMAVLPLISKDESIGALYIGKDFDFSESDIHILTAISELAANAIQRATFHEEIQRRLQRLDALHKIDLAISASMDLNVTLNILLDHVISQLKVDAADILEFNAHTQTLYYSAGRGFIGNTITQTSLRLGEGCPGIAALDRQMAIFPDLAEAGCFKRLRLLSSENFVAYFGVPLIAKGEVKGVLELFHREKIQPDHEWLNFLEMLAGQAAIAIDSATLFDHLQRSNLELVAAYNTTLDGWARALELRDRETEGHTRRVTQMTLSLASAMGVRSDELVHLQRGAMLHDIGKMGIPDNILTKPGPLTDQEWAIMRQHPIYARDLLVSIPYLRLALDIPYSHHEKWDGSGYPRGLQGEEIPLAARIFAIIDVWDALLSDRPYRKSWSEDKVLAYLQEQSEIHFDPQVVDTFFALITRSRLIDMTAA